MIYSTEVHATVARVHEYLVGIYDMPIGETRTITEYDWQIFWTVNHNPDKGETPRSEMEKWIKIWNESGLTIWGYDFPTNRDPYIYFKRTHIDHTRTKSTAMPKATISVFQFWKDNKLDQHYTLSIDELMQQFSKWLTTRHQDWINYYPADRAIRFFITDASGLSSVFEESEYQDMYEPLREIYIQAHK